jgi:putative SOS response-associated peptidase YedK
MRSQSSGGNDDSLRLVLRTMKWGLVPSWSKHEDKTLSTTNARSENLVEDGGMWGSIKGKKRCAVVCQGYYEWLKRGKERFPHFTKPKDGNKLMLLAGLFDCAFLNGSTEPLWSFTIVTTSACKDFTWLHDRQPVILSSREALDTWLDTSSQTWTSALTKLVEPYDNSVSPLECYQVPKEVGKVGTESRTFIEPIANRKDGIQAMFSRQKQAQSSPTKNTSQKRKRSSSPSTSRTIEHRDSVETEVSTSKKLGGNGKQQNEDQEVICIDHSPSPTPKTKTSHSKSCSPVRSLKTLSKVKNASKSKKTKTAKEDTSSAQITQFFSKT